MAYKQRWSQYFDLLDTNNNGFIDPGDSDGAIQRVAETGLFSPEQLTKIKASLDKLEFDANKDNQVTKEEWLDGVEKIFIGKNPPDWWKEAEAEIFAIYDHNNDGEITEDEMVAAVTNTDSTISADQARASFKKVFGTGKLDLEGFYKLLWTWSTSPNPEPDVEVLLTYLKKK